MPSPGKPQRLLAGALLFLAAIAVYLPALRAGFVWDDDQFLWNNALIDSPTGLFAYWFNPPTPDYFPLTSSMLWIEWRLFGMEHPAGYHAINILLHAASSLLLWRILARLNLPGAWLAAAVFAVHPVNVEAVAWITQRKSTLPMVFALLSTLLYFRTPKPGAASASGAAPPSAPLALLRHDALSLLCFLLALLAKTAVVPLPAVFLLLTWWRSGKITRRDFARTLPFFALALALGLVTVWFQYTHAIGDVVVRDDSILSRLALSGAAVWFYLSKALLPLNLAFIYPRWEEADTASPLAWLPLLALAATAFALWRFRAVPYCRAALVALAVYVAMLTPVLGFLNIFFMKYAFVADHWQYFALPAAIAPLAALLASTTQRLGKPAALNPAFALAAALILPALAILSWNMAGDYKDEETLWRKTIKRNPAAWLAHYNLGVLLAARDQIDEAASAYRAAIEINPDYPDAHHNLGLMHYRQGRVDDAMAGYRRALEIDPAFAKAHSNLAVALRAGGRLDEALAHYRSALASDPHFVEARFNYAIALDRAGRLPDAIVQYRQTLAIDPTLAEAHTNLALALFRQGQDAEARGHLEKALALRPDDPGTLNNLAWHLATTPDDAARDGTRALELARRAVALSGETEPNFLRTLAAATAATGDYAGAAGIAARALALAETRNNPALTASLRQERALYRAGSPVRSE